MASLARWDSRGSTEIKTRTGSAFDTSGVRSVQRDEAIGAVDDVGQHDEAAVRQLLGVAERDTAFLEAERSDEQLGAAIGEGGDAWVVERAHAVVDQVEIDIAAAGERGFGQTDRGLQIGGTVGPGGEQKSQLFSGEVHRGRA